MSPESAWPNLDAVDFICEADGRAERELKQTMIDLFADSSDVRAAWLIRVRWRAPEDSVLLGIVAPGCDRKRLRNEMGEAVSQYLSSLSKNVWLDCTIMSRETAARADEVAAPFYRR